MKILKEDVAKTYVFKCHYTDGRTFTIRNKADNIIYAWKGLGQELDGWVIGMDGHLADVELIGDYSNEVDAYKNKELI